VPGGTTEGRHIVRGKILFATGIAIGYVLGARAGRQRYEEIKAQASKLWNDPRVQHQVKQVEEFAKDKGPEVVDMLADGAKKVASTVSGARKQSGGSARPANRSPKPSGDESSSQ